MDAIGALLDKIVSGRTSNGMPDGGFYEHGRERDDGAIVGTVWKLLSDGKHVNRRGSFHITPDGKVKRFPGLSRELLGQAERAAVVKYEEIHGPDTIYEDWRRDARLTALLLKTEGDAIAPHCWNDLQEIAQAYQSEFGVTFLVLPDCKAQPMHDFLMDIAAQK